MVKNITLTALLCMAVLFLVSLNSQAQIRRISTNSSGTQLKEQQIGSNSYKKNANSESFSANLSRDKQCVSAMLSHLDSSSKQMKAEQINKMSDAEYSNALDGYFSHAIYEERLPAVKKMAECGADVNKDFAKNGGYFYFAIHNGKIRSAKLLLDIYGHKIKLPKDVVAVYLVNNVTKGQEDVWKRVNVPALKLLFEAGAVLNLGDVTVAQVEK